MLTKWIDGVIRTIAAALGRSRTPVHDGRELSRVAHLNPRFRPRAGPPDRGALPDLRGASRRDPGRARVRRGPVPPGRRGAARTPRQGGRRGFEPSVPLSEVRLVRWDGGGGPSLLRRSIRRFLGGSPFGGP